MFQKLEEDVGAKVLPLRPAEPMPRGSDVENPFNPRKFLFETFFPHAVPPWKPVLGFHGGQRLRERKRTSERKKSYMDEERMDRVVSVRRERSDRVSEIGGRESVEKDLSRVPWLPRSRG
jgi:hypothetical protein